MTRKIFVWTLLLVTLCLVVAGCGTEKPTQVVSSGFTPSAVCIVPDVVGLGAATAEGQLVSLGLQPAKSNQYDPGVAEGAVISQDPPAGTELEPCQGGVTIVVSLGSVSQPTAAPAPTDTPAPLMPKPTTPVDFSEEFNGPDLDKNIWEQVGPPAQVKDGVLQIKSNLSTCPYIYAKQNLFPKEGNFVVAISFRYLSLTGWGNGIVVDKQTWTQGHVLQYEDVVYVFLSIFQDQGVWPLSVYLMGNNIVSAPNDLTQHTVEVRYTGKYEVIYDGSLVYTSSPTTDRPSTLWIGNPTNFQGNGDWTSFEVDYIRIKSIP